MSPSRSTADSATSAWAFEAPTAAANLVILLIDEAGQEEPNAWGRPRVNILARLRRAVARRRS